MRALVKKLLSQNIEGVLNLEAFYLRTVFTMGGGHA